MKFRTKLFYAFISLGFLSTLVALFIIFGEAARMMFREIQAKVVTLTLGSREALDEKLLFQVVSQGTKESLPYQQLKKQLLEIQKVNEKADAYVKRIYLLQFDPQSKAYHIVMGVGEENSYLSLAFKAPYPSALKVSDSLEPFVKTHLYKGEKLPASWISGYVPIFLEGESKPLILGIDVATKEIYQQLEQLLLHGVGAFVVSIFVAVIFAYFLSNLVSSSLSLLCHAVKKIGGGDLSARSHLNTQDEFNDLSEAINEMARGLQEREKLKMGFTRYVSQYALDELLRLDKPVSLEGERKKVTVLFSDIRSFTQLSEKLSPEEVLNRLNAYFEEMIEVIFQYNGTLDKFIGDGLMVEFGAPLENKEQELYAVLAALEMHRRLSLLSDRWEKEGKSRLKMGIGIHTGLAVVGNIGSVKRMEYTAIGDTVNVASRLEQFTKVAQKQIIVSDTVYEKIKDRFICEDLKELEIRGRESVIQAYAIDPFLKENQQQVQELL